MKFSSEGGFIGLLLGIGGLIYAGYKSIKLEQISKKIDMTIGEIDTKNPVDIQQSVVDKAIERTVNRSVASAVRETTATCKKEIYDDISKQVKAAVEKEYKTISDSVSDKIQEQVANIDQYALQEQVKRKAESTIVRNFQGQLNTMVNDAMAQTKEKIAFLQKTGDLISDLALGGRNRSHNDGRKFTINLDD